MILSFSSTALSLLWLIMLSCRNGLMQGKRFEQTTQICYVVKCIHNKWRKSKMYNYYQYKFEWNSDSSLVGGLALNPFTTTTTNKYNRINTIILLVGWSVCWIKWCYAFLTWDCLSPVQNSINPAGQWTSVERM